MKKNHLLIVFLASFIGTINNVSIAGLIGVSKIVVTPSAQNSSGWLQVSEVVAVETGTGVDLALATAGAIAIGSSNWPSSSANFAIDSVNPAAFPNIFHSNENDGSSFLSITLASPSELDSIMLFGRADCCSERDIYNIGFFDLQGGLLFSSLNLNATSSSHSVSLDLPNTAAPVPESTTVLLLGFGLAGFGFAHRKKLS